MQGWIKLHRKLVDWEWYTDNPVKIVFIHLLLTANHEPKKWQGKIIEAGEKVTSLAALADETNLSVKQVRLALQKLENTKEIECKRTNRYTLIKVLNYSVYQSYDEYIGQTKDKQRANKGQTKGNKQEDKEDKECKNNYKSVCINKQSNNYKDDRLYCAPTLAEVKAYCKEQGLIIKADKFFYHYQSKGWQGVVDWKAKAHSWNEQDKSKPGTISRPATYDLDQIIKDTESNTTIRYPDDEERQTLRQRIMNNTTI
jgi:hypothetical protein